MTLVSEIIRDAYRESNLIAISADPTADEIAEALVLLNRLVLSSYAGEAGENIFPFYLGRNNIHAPEGFPYYENLPYEPDWFVPLNVRLMLNLTAPTSVYLNPTPQEGSRFALIDASKNLDTNVLTILGNGNTIEGQNSLVINEDGANREYMYRQDEANWFKIAPLLVSDPMPFPEEFDDFFVIGLALRLNPRHGVAMDPQTQAAYNRIDRQFKARYRQNIQTPSELALLITPGTYRRRFIGLNTQYANSLFSSGRGFPFGPLYY